MGWNDWSYWKKGLIIGIIATVISYALGFIGFSYLMYPFGKLSAIIVCNLFNGCAGEWKGFGESILLGVIFEVLFFTLVVWIYGKIKR